MASPVSDPSPLPKNDVVKDLTEKVRAAARIQAQNIAQINVKNDGAARQGGAEADKAKSDRLLRLRAEIQCQRMTMSIEEVGGDSVPVNETYCA